ncbi:3-hydroxy-9,10-secoandrosta-1,3,5(10)-triene-9,17-dione monooxygenase [Sphingobium sp. B1D7B]|uniref:acyl-CoA dehydrogenase family protein n=1 Tax=unclassified Sphingobium TaxID=2611147 RepID=UPI0022250AB1|nr:MULTISPECIES: acyl-CoA dehydrogenase family protein [unclassified Sphingobium]MCW2391271.1 3-hydroxy-9,10-secoandrosta-1,3,5(10)-triene-9,17-dione monooxygenase [Sphingobium sp. B11D3A]MCW2406482.1 3-hydroxy-9,10-secoandrosta-1,3,5(10)-triene-9,17-dione monooxygenase [Sphingobium sp. B1D7B]MCW2412679.1 3-hydroxy-9,10-secoandrosta-1,3,5(10)-triene-9,17-dione monooxygenase [Sphingobium sp. B8D3D]MCW2415023.1 3-hydroxy-9,10-secoandrosta-1,3,5(10)-triene-9,17-dione monooxygenase [Sphingobium sp.
MASQASADVATLDIAGRYPVVESSADAIARIRALLPQIAAADAESESARRLSPHVVDAIRQTGLFGIVMPRNLGGSELGFADLVRVTAEIGTMSGSAAWIFGVLAGHSWLINLFPEQAQREVMDDPTTLIGTVFRLGGEVVEENGGYRLTGGAGRFCSGIDYASWVIIGNAVKKADGRMEPRFFVLPKSEIEIVDDWFTMGMRATGSRSIKIDSAFIPAHRSCSLADMLAGSTPGARVHEGAVYRMPFSNIAPFSIVGAPLGMARGMVQRFAADIGKRLDGADPLEVAEQSATFARIAEIGAEVDAALALILEDARMVDEARDPAEITPLLGAQISRNWAWGVQRARHAANRIFEASGGSAIYDGSAMQRLFRDMNSGAQHFAFTWDRAMTGYGRAAAGLKAGAFAIPKGK